MDKKRTPMTPRRIMALLCIIILAGLYLLNLILALIGSSFTHNLLKATLAISIMLPILMYGCLVAMQAAGHFRKKPEDELTEEEKIGYYQMIAEMDEKKREENASDKKRRNTKKP